MEREENLASIKILFIGRNFSKFDIAKSYVNESLEKSNIKTLGMDYRNKKIVIKEKTVNIEMWDTCDLERFKIIQSSFYKNANGIVFVYDTNDEASMQMIIDFPCLTKLKNTNIQIIIAANSSNGFSESQRSQGEIFASSLEFPIFFVNPVTGENIQAMFRKLIDLIVTKNPSVLVPRVKIEVEKQAKKLKCRI